MFADMDMGPKLVRLMCSKGSHACLCEMQWDEHKCWVLFYFCVHSPSKSQGSVHTAPWGLLLCAWRPLVRNAQEKASQLRSSLPGWGAAGGCVGWTPG